jgi:ABC-2 type transport system ATP-binding protein
VGAPVPARGLIRRAALSEPVLRVEGLGKRYGSREALRDVSFNAHAGEMVAVIGPNGAGKTTLLSILAGVQPASAGSVSHAAGEIGWVPQQPALYSKLSVVENLRLFARLEKVGDVDAVLTRMLEQTGLAERAHERIDRLSGGNRQRVNVALGLLSGPPVILLDEPSSALDPAQRERLWGFITTLAAAGTSVVFSTHIVAEAARYAPRVLVLDQGTLLFDGSPEDLERAAEDGAAGDDPAAASKGAALSRERVPQTGVRDFEHAFVTFLRTRARA